MKIRLVLVFNLSVLFLVTPALTFANEKPEILNVVEAFCKLDFEGARLSSRTGHRITPYVTWEDEPGWDIALAIKSYRIGTVSVDRQKARVTVR